MFCWDWEVPTWLKGLDTIVEVCIEGVADVTLGLVVVVVSFLVVDGSPVTVDATGTALVEIEAGLWPTFKLGKPTQSFHKLMKVQKVYITFETFYRLTILEVKRTIRRTRYLFGRFCCSLASPSNCASSLRC